MPWKLENALERFREHRTVWDELNRIHGNHVLLDSRFVDVLLRCFGTKDTLLASMDDGGKRGRILVEKGKWGFWETFQPSQAPIGMVLLEDAESSCQQVRDLIGELPGPALGFSVMQQDPDFTVFKEFRNEKNVEYLEYIRTARVTLGGSFEDYWKNRGKNLTHNLSRQRRRLTEKGGRLDLVVSRTGPEMEECIRDHARMEEMGWKAGKGSAIGMENTQGKFYREVLEQFCASGEAVVYRLQVNGQTVASDLCLERGGVLIVLKTAYDESVEGLSLGMLLHQDVFKMLFAEGRVRVVEFYGRLRDWHTKWTNEIRTMHHLNFYRIGILVPVRRFMKSF